MSTTMSIETTEGAPDKTMSPVQDLSADDQAAMAAIGAKQVLHRRFNFWTALAFGVCTSGTVSPISPSSPGHS